MRNSLVLIGSGDKFLNKIPVAQSRRTTINKWYIMKVKSFCNSKHTNNKTRQQPMDWERIFTIPPSDRGLISKIYKELKISNTNNPNKKWGTELNREFSRNLEWPRRT